MPSLLYAPVCILLLSILTIGGCATAEPSADLPYGSLEREKLDIYPAPGPAKAPVMIFVHGGGWHIGNKNRVHYKPAAFNKEGLVFVSVGYPLMPDHPVETQAQSLTTAIKWVVDNIETYNGDPTQLHLMGHSAGAHLVGLVVADQHYFRSVGVDPSRVKSIINVDGASWNVPWRMRTLSDSGRFARRMFRQTFGQDRERWQQLSPYHYLTEGSYLPPVLFLTAEDKTAENLRSDRVVARISEVGGSSCIQRIDDRNHGTINRKMGEKDDSTFSSVMTFIRSNGNCAS